MQDTPGGFRSAATLVTTLALAACAGGTTVRSDYAQASIQPEVTRASDSELRVRYRVPLESNYFAAGVDYAVDGDTLRIGISRCAINTTCAPMVKGSVPAPGEHMAEARVPYRGETVVLVFADGEMPVAL